LLVRGPEALGYQTPLCTCPRVAHLIEQEVGIRYAAAEGRTIVFVDESGLSLQPHRCRTWAPGVRCGGCAAVLA